MGGTYVRMYVRSNTCSFMYEVCMYVRTWSRVDERPVAG